MDYIEFTKQKSRIAIKSFEIIGIKDTPAGCVLFTTSWGSIPIDESFSVALKRLNDQEDYYDPEADVEAD